MRKLVVIIIALSFSNLLFSTNYYVDTNGSSSNDGTTLETPFASIVTAISKVSAGDIIWVRGGTYEYSSKISISKSGAETDTIFLLAYADEKPVFDFSSTSFGTRGMQLSGSYWKIKGFEMKLAGDNALFISGGNNTIELCSFHDNKDTGLQMGGGAHDNKVINCDSYFNADPTDYGDADGFAAKLDVGSNNYFYGCRAWYNVDDGWDGYMRGNNDVSTVLENCWTWKNGYFKNGADGGASANGNGFKVGGSDDKNLKHNFTLINCLAFYNKSKGFDQNNNMGSMYFYNCTGFGNEGYDYSIPKSIASGKTAEVKNCVLYNGNTNFASHVIQETNSWDANFTVDEGDFISIDTTGVTGPRQSDGSLPEIEFMHLVSGSDLIDAGIDLGYTYMGSAPDLGAFETLSGVGFKILSQTTIFSAWQSSDHTITLRFEKESAGDVSVDFYNLNGRKAYVQKLDGLHAGMHEAVITVPFSNGFYLVRLNNNGQVNTAKMIFK